MIYRYAVLQKRSEEGAVYYSVIRDNPAEFLEDALESVSSGARLIEVGLHRVESDEDFRGLAQKLMERTNEATQTGDWKSIEPTKKPLKETTLELVG